LVACRTVFRSPPMIPVAGRAAGRLRRNNVALLAFSMEETLKIKWALVFLAVALAAGVMGLSGLAGTCVDLAMFALSLAFVIFLVPLVLGYTAFKKVA